jgi:sugar O-acyltransferase (sialic acid O-acetyltransferase NeuD family)
MISPGVDGVVLWGASGHARVLREAIGDAAKIVALFDNDPTVTSPFPEIPLFTGMEGFERWWRERTGSGRLGLLVAIGGARGSDRVDIQRRLQSRVSPICVIHPSAFVAADARVGLGSQVLANSAVCVGARLGDACIINTGATVDHECELGAGVHVCPGAHLAGCVTVGDDVMIGTGAVVLPRIRIGSGARVGAGAVVTRDVEAGATVVGNPARARKRTG